VNIYQDRFGRWHDKPCINGKPSSNNGWLYSAVAAKLGLQVNISKSAYDWCYEYKERHPFITTRPYWSRDEEIGLRYLHNPAKYHCNWDFWPSAIAKPKFNLFLFIKQACQCVDWKSFNLKHRNYWWQNELWQIGHTAFVVPLNDRYFCLNLQGRYNPIYHLIHIISHWKQPKDRSARLLRFLKTGKDRQAVANYFPKDHPFQEYV
jgi:hypothetical protein